MRTLVVAASLALLIIGWFAYQDDRGVLGLSGDMTLQIARLLMVLLLVSGAGYGFSKLREHPKMALAGALFWTGLIIVIVLLYSIFK